MALTYSSVTDKWTDSFIIDKQNNTKLTLATNEKYVNGDIEFTIGVESGSAAVAANQSITENPSIYFSASNALTADYSGSKSITGTSVAGWINQNSVTSATVTTSGSTTVNSLLLPASYSFTMNMQATNSSTDNSVLKINSAKNRKVLVEADGTTGNQVSIKAKNNSSDSTKTEAIVVENGYWKSQQLTEANTEYYGSVYATKGILTPSVSVVNAQASITPTGLSFLSSGTSPFYITLTTTDGSATPTASVSTAGYVTNSDSKTATSATAIEVTGSGTKKYIPKIAGTLEASGTLKYTPTISVQNTPNGITIINANASTATTSPTTNGIYAVVKAIGGTNNITPSVNITTAGYGTNTNHSLTASSIAVGANDSAITYIPIQTASPTFKGGAVSGTATATSSNCSISDSTNHSGVSVTAEASATRAVVQYNSAVSGWVEKNASENAYAASSATNLTSTIYYINGVTIQKPSTGTRSFQITVPDGDVTSVTFTFTVDSNGNTVIT